MWEISKEFDFCYGHRVWSQSLNVEFSLDSCLMCRHLHGHQGKVIVYLKSDSLKSGMVTDFKHLNWFKKFLDDVIDHKFIIDINDPLFKTLLPNIDKKDFVLKMREKNIGLQYHYIPINKQPYYKNLGYGKENTPVMDEYYEKAISLPIYPNLSLDEQNYIFDKIFEILK